jgi:hypothetical protein
LPARELRKTALHAKEILAAKRTLRDRRSKKECFEATVFFPHSYLLENVGRKTM